MDQIKGVFRRATQTTREKMGNSDHSQADNDLIEVIRRIRVMERSSAAMSDKVQKLAKALEDVGNLTRDIAEEHKSMMAQVTTTPVTGESSPAPEIPNLTNELSSFGSELAGKAQELGRELKSNAFDNLSAFVRDVPQLRTMEDDRKKKQLEHDFFKTKVAGLIKQPPKDHTRIPRNEGILENWRQQLWQSTESLKVACSNMWSNGTRALDLAVYTVAMINGNYFGYGLNSCKQHFVSAKMPLYSTAPLLPAAPLPPPPPTWQPPMPQAPPPGFGGQQQQQQPGFGAPQQGAPQQGFSPQGQQQQHQGGFSPQSGASSPNQQQWGGGQNQQQSQPSFGGPQQNQQQSPQQQQQWNQNQQQQPQQQQQQQWNNNNGSPPQQQHDGNGYPQRQQQQPQQQQQWNNNNSGPQQNQSFAPDHQQQQQQNQGASSWTNDNNNQQQQGQHQQNQGPSGWSNDNNQQQQQHQGGGFGGGGDQQQQQSPQ